MKVTFIGIEEEEGWEYEFPMECVLRKWDTYFSMANDFELHPYVCLGVCACVCAFVCECCVCVAVKMRG